ncbi:MAG TPA: hypothetical protein VJT71_06250 [Pyrinomonadaceae bacterium]|nr:hypothetical protein [Pyrinomonadaceae bacterium]
MAKQKAKPKTSATTKTKATKKTASKRALGAVDTSAGIQIYVSTDRGRNFSVTGHGQIDTNNKTAVIDWIDNWNGVPRLHPYYSYQLKAGGQTFPARMTSITYPGQPAAYFQLL